MRQFPNTESGFIGARAGGAYTPPVFRDSKTGRHERRVHIVKVLAWVVAGLAIAALCLTPLWLHVANPCKGFTVRDGVGKCVECLIDQQCSVATGTRFNKSTCDPARGICVGCLADTDCKTAGDACVGHVCVAGCTSDAQCASPTASCNTKTGKCAECLTDKNCRDDQQCNAHGVCACACGANQGCVRGSSTCVPTCGHCNDDFPVCGADGLCAKCAPGSINATGGTCLPSGLAYGTCGGAADCSTLVTFPACTDNNCGGAFPAGTAIGFVSSPQPGGRAVDTLSQPAWDVVNVLPANPSAYVAFVVGPSGLYDIVLRAPGTTAVRLTAKAIKDGDAAQFNSLSGLNLNDMTMVYAFTAVQASDGTSAVADFKDPFYIKYGALFLSGNETSGHVIWSSEPRAWTMFPM